MSKGSGTTRVSHASNPMGLSENPIVGSSRASMSDEEYKAQMKRINSISIGSGYEERELTIGDEKVRIYSVPSSGGRTVIRAVGEESGEFFRTVYTKSGSVGYGVVGRKKEAVSDLKSALVDKLDAKRKAR